MGFDLKPAEQKCGRTIRKMTLKIGKMLITAQATSDSLFSLLFIYV
jgi:hypothetical protein